MSNTPTQPKDYTLAQQRFALCMFANDVGNIKPPGTQDQLEQYFQQALNTQFSLMAGGWKLAWGPKVYKEDPNDPKTAPINAWYIATSASQKLAVLAIAGTAHDSTLGWLQNVDVPRVVDWKKWVSTWTLSAIPTPTAARIIFPPDPYAALGTCQGVTNVLTYQSKLVSPGSSVPQFLNSLPKDYRICVTGHSMGGDLSPAVALGLVQANLVNGYNVYVVPFAGASPGDVVWANQWAAQFPMSGEGIGTINADFFNTSDLVPQAWSIQKDGDTTGRILYNILDSPKLYKDVKLGYEVGKLLRGAVELGEDASQASKISYRGIPGFPFPTSTPIPRSIETTAEFGPVFTRQHVTEYLNLFNVGTIVQGFRDMLQTHSSLDARKEIAKNEVEIEVSEHPYEAARAAY